MTTPSTTQPQTAPETNISGAVLLLTAPIAFLLCILAANVATTHYGLVPVGFGLAATAGTYFAGATFVLRDLVHDRAGALCAIVLIALGAGLSYVVADPFIALASGVAFLTSEIADLLIYTPLRTRGYLRAAVCSNLFGAAVDTLLFVHIAGFGITSQVFAGQMVGKLWITLAAALAVGGARAVLRKPLNTAGA